MSQVDIYKPAWNEARQPLDTRNLQSGAVAADQYSLPKILAIWSAAVIPMVFLGWVAAPLLGDSVDLGVGSENNEAFTRAALLTLGLIWQFALAMMIIFREEGDLRWATIRNRCWLNTPRDPRTGQGRSKLWLWLLPALVVVVLVQVAPFVQLWELVFPFLGEPDKYSLAELMESDHRKASLEGAWQVLGLFIVLGIFNTVLGEELLFRGILLPRMQGVFGRGDWLANGVLFGLYHLHQPWTIIGSTIGGTLGYALPSRRFRSAWMGIIVHSAETVFFLFLALGLVLGVV